MTELGASHSDSPPVLTPDRLRRSADIFAAIDPAFRSYLREFADRSSQVHGDSDVVKPDGRENLDRIRETVLGDPEVAHVIDRSVREVCPGVIDSADRAKLTALARDAEPDPTG